jgi:hypothetical protein
MALGRDDIAMATLPSPCAAHPLSRGLIIG